MTEISKKNRNVPTLRFPEFKDEWIEKRLGEIASFTKGKAISKADITENGQIECIRYGELYTYYNEVIDEVKSRTNLDQDSLVISEANDVIIPASGETQLDIATASCVIRSGIALGGDLNIIKTSNNGVFLSYYLNSRKKLEIASLSQGISVVHLYAKQLSTLNVSIPSKKEQDKISNFLALLDQRIKTQNKIIEQLESLIKAISELLFSQKIRFKGYKGLWKLKRLGEICTYKNGGSFEKEIVEYGKYNLITLNSLDIKGDLKKIHKKVNRTDKSLNKGDLVIVLSDVAHGNFLGLTDIIPDDSYVLNQRMGALKPNKEVNRFFLKSVINANQKYFKLKGQGSSQLNLSRGAVEDFHLYLPTFEEQTAIANFLSRIVKKINTEKAIIEKYQSQKLYLINNLFI